MNETLETLVRRAIDEPFSDRDSLYRELLGSSTYLLNIGEPGVSSTRKRVAKAEDTFSIWADQDPQSGGVWAPVFTSAERVCEFVAQRGLEAPEGREFYWMGHEPGQLFGMLLSVGCFAGMRINPSDRAGLAVEWPEVRALSDGCVPQAAPFLYELPVREFRIPPGTKVVVGPMDPSVTGKDGEQLLFPEVGEFGVEEYRRLVSVSFGATGRGSASAWTPCRHLAEAVRRWMGREPARSGDYADFLVRSLMGFEMFGEAEALCDWLAAQDGNEAVAWVFLSAVYGRTGRLDSCAELCERGMRKYPEERSFYVNQARAYAQLDDRASAAEAARRGLAHFPDDAALRRFL